MKYKYTCPNCHIRTNNFYCECCGNPNLNLVIPIEKTAQINTHEMQLITY